jgi:hypothetical protein
MYPATLLHVLMTNFDPDQATVRSSQPLAAGRAHLYGIPPGEVSAIATAAGGAKLSLMLRRQNGRVRAVFHPPPSWL